MLPFLGEKSLKNDSRYVCVSVMMIRQIISGLVLTKVKNLCLGSNTTDYRWGLTWLHTLHQHQIFHVKEKAKLEIFSLSSFFFPSCC